MWDIFGKPAVSLMFVVASIGEKAPIVKKLPSSTMVGITLLNFFLLAFSISRFQITVVYTTICEECL